MLNLCFILVLVFAISSSHGVKLNDQDETSVRRNAVDFLSKMLQIGNGDNEYNNQNNPQDQQSKEGISNKLLQMPGDESHEEKKGQRSPWDPWYSWYEEYKKRKHDHHHHGHKHHKKHHTHSLEYYYDYDSYEDDYKKHIFIPKHENQKHIVIPKNGNDGNQKHIVIPKEGKDENEKHIVFPGLLASIFGKQKERMEIGGYGNQPDEQLSHGSGDGQKWKPPQYGSEENKKVNSQGYGKTEETPNAQGFLRQLWNIYKAFKEKDGTDLF